MDMAENDHNMYWKALVPKSDYGQRQTKEKQSILDGAGQSLW